MHAIHLSRAAAAVVLPAGLTVFGNTITVINSNDQGPASLQQAILDALSGDMTIAGPGGRL